MLLFLWFVLAQNSGNPDAVRLLHQEAIGIRQRRDFRAAERLLHEAVLQAEKSADPYVLARNLHLWALALREVKDPAAESVHRREIEVLEAIVPSRAGSGILLAQALHSLAVVLIAKDRSQEAEPLLGRALKLAGKDPYSQALVLNSFGELKYRQGQDAEAQRMLASAWTAYSGIRDPEPAEDALIHTLDRAQAFSLLHAHILNNHGLVDYRLGRTTQAENAWRRSIALYRELGPAGGASIGAPLANLSDLLRRRKRFPEAIGFATQALEVFDVGLGSNSSRSAQVLHLLGGTLIDCGEYRQARSVLTRALDITNHTVGPRHRQTGLIIASLAYLESREGNWSRSLELYRDGIQIVEESSGPNHPELTTPLAGYSKALRRLKRTGEARAIDQRRLAIRALATAGALSTVSIRELNDERAPAK